MHSLDKMHWVEKVLLKATNPEKVSSIGHSFTKYLVSKAKVTRFEKTSLELKVAEILKMKPQIPTKTKLRTLLPEV